MILEQKYKLILAQLILMKQEKYKVPDPRLSPLFIDTEFVPSSMPFFTLYKRGCKIPSVLPYSPQKTFNDLQKFLTRKQMPSIQNNIPIKDYKIQINRRYLDGDKLEIGKECEIIQVPRAKGVQQQSRQKCEVAFVMLASLEDVLHIQMRRKTQLDFRAQIIAAVNDKYKLKLSEKDIQLNRITFTTKKDKDNITEIRFNPTPIGNLSSLSSLSKLLLSKQNVLIIGIDVISDRFDSQCLLRKENRFISGINIDSNKILRIKTSKGQFQLDYERLKQFQARQVLQMLGQQNAQRKSLKLPEKILAPTDLIHQLGYIFKGENTLINFVDVIVATQDQIFLSEMKRIQPLNNHQINQFFLQENKLNSKQNNKNLTTALNLLCSQTKNNQLKGESFNYWFHIINQFTRSFFTHTMDFFQSSIVSRCITTLYKQINYLLFKHKGDVYRRVNFELDYAKGDVVEFNGFIVATAKRQLLQQYKKPLYETRPTIIKIIHKNGKLVRQYSCFNTLEQVIFLPYTKFKVLQRRQDIFQINLTLQQLPKQTNVSVISNVVLWMDRKGSDQARRMFQQRIRFLPISLRIYQLQSTEKFVDWFQNNKNLASSQLVNITVVTNMVRLQNEKQNQNAGIETILKGKQLISFARFIVYVRQIDFANKKLLQNKIDVEYYVTNSSTQVQRYLISSFNKGCKKKKTKQQNAFQKANRIPKQNWKQFFPDIFDQEFKKEIKMIKEHTIHKGNYNQKNTQLNQDQRQQQKQTLFMVQQQKTKPIIPKQNKIQLLDKKSPQKVIIDQKDKPWIKSISSPRNNQQKSIGTYNNEYKNIKPSIQVKSQILQNDLQIDDSDQFQAIQAQKQIKKPSQSNIYTIGSAFKSKIPSNIPKVPNTGNQKLQ